MNEIDQKGSERLLHWQKICQINAVILNVLLIKES